MRRIQWSESAKRVVAALIRWSGVPWLIRETWARHKVTILLYHHPSPEDFRRQLSYLSRSYTFITLDLLVAAIYAGDMSSVPTKSLVITFDDGYQGTFGLLEICKEFGVVPTIYICSAIVGTNRHFWWEEAADDREALKHFPSAPMEALLETRYAFTFTREYASRQALSGEEVELMKPFASFQSHGRFHRPLLLATAEQRYEEIAVSKREVEELTGSPCLHFSYPNGDYSEEDVRLLRQLGYRSARTADLGWNDLRTDPFELKIAGAPERGSGNAVASSLIAMYVRLGFRGSWRGKHRGSLSPTSRPAAGSPPVDRSPKPATQSRE